MLRESFRHYLEDLGSAARRAAMIDALTAAGLTTEARLLAHYASYGPGRDVIADGPFAGREAHVGAHLPQAEAGALWFDIAELSLMLLLGRDPRELADLSPEARRRLGPTVSWMSLRPTARWQVGAFLDVAPRESISQPYDLPFPFFDPARLLAGDEQGAVTRSTCDEAGLYANWFGKGLCTEEDWRAAIPFFTGGAGRPPWGDPPREWAGEAYFDEALRIVVSPDTVGLDPHDLVDETDPKLRMVYGEWAAPDDVTFRTAVSMQGGLALTNVPSESGGLVPVRVLGRLVRPEA
jgi:hypothetical protein